MVGVAARQREPQPLGQHVELAFLLLTLFAGVLSLAALTGLALAAKLFGSGWVWLSGPDPLQHMVAVDVGLLQGMPGLGLNPIARDCLPADWVVYGCVVVSELLTLTLVVGAGLTVSRYRRPGDARRGMASRREAARVLGLGRLRHAQAVIRPDLARPTTAAEPASKVSLAEPRDEWWRA